MIVCFEPEAEEEFLVALHTVSHKLLQTQALPSDPLPASQAALLHRVRAKFFRRSDGGGGGAEGSSRHVLAARFDSFLYS